VEGASTTFVNPAFWAAANGKSTLVEGPEDDALAAAGDDVPIDAARARTARLTAGAARNVEIGLLTNTVPFGERTQFLRGPRRSRNDLASAI
jgi:hypothetical protein